jgi:hypothetical protein
VAVHNEPQRTERSPIPRQKSYRKVWADGVGNVGDVEPAGRSGSSPCPTSSFTSLSRREFFGVVAALTAWGLIGTQRRTQAIIEANAGVMIYRLSLHGRRGSNAAKKHNANKRFATAEAADTHRAHPGDHSRVVPIIIGAAEFDRLFPSPDVTVADLRTTLPICTGDCNRNHQVTVDEVLTMVDGALGSKPVTACTAGDPGRDGAFTIDEIVHAVHNALTGCS